MRFALYWRMMVFAACVSLVTAAPTFPQSPISRYDGSVAVTGDRITVTLAPNGEAAIGAHVHTFRRVDIGQREVGVLTGVYLIVGTGAGGLAYAVRDPARNETLPGASLQDVVQITSSGIGELLLLTDPPGARILWNGALIGTTPDTLVLAAGDYALRLEHPGRVPTTYPFVVQRGRIAYEHIRLDEPMPCQGFVDTAEAYFERQDYDQVRANLMVVQRGGCRPSSSSPVIIGAWLESLPHIVSVQSRLASTVSAPEVAFALRRYYEALRTGNTEAMATQRRLLCRMAPTDPFIRGEAIGC